MFDFAIKLVEPARILIVVAMALTLASSGWFFVVGPEPVHLADVNRPNRTSELSSIDIETVVALNLFGEADPERALGDADRSDAPETTLRLQLVGVFQANEPEGSAAIVAERGKPAELFEVGDRIPGNAELVEVYTDRIVIRRGGVFETLRFEDSEPLLQPGDSPPTSSRVAGRNNRGTARGPVADPGEQEDGAPRESVRDLIGNYREKLNDDPAAVLGSVGLKAVTSGEAKGYVLGKLASSPYLAQTGLQAGDRILSVNGRPVGDVRQDRLEIDNLLAQGSARIEVQRGTRRFFVTASFK